jgi:hypothetical protein
MLAGLLACLMGASVPVQAQILDLDWATSAGSQDLDSGFYIVVDGAGNSYVTGMIVRSATFGKGEAQETVLQTKPYKVVMFVAKYDRNGRLVWATRFGSRDYIHLWGMAVDEEGQSYVTGYFADKITFGQGEVHETTLTRGGLFVAKYDRDGRLLWARTDGTPGGWSNARIAVDNAGNSYVTGSFNATTTFGAGEARQTTLTRGAGTSHALAS